MGIQIPLPYPTLPYQTIVLPYPPMGGLRFRGARVSFRGANFLVTLWAWGTISTGQNRLLRRCNWRKRQSMIFHLKTSKSIGFPLKQWNSVCEPIVCLFRQLHRLKSRFWPAEMFPQAIPYHYPAWAWPPNPLLKHFFTKNAENLQKSCFLTKNHRF